MNRAVACLIILVLCLSMTACAVATVITDIEVAQTVLSLAAPVVASFAGPGALLAQSYMSAAANGLGCVLTAAQAAGATTATVSAAFASCFGSAAIPVLPAGTPAYVVAAITAVSAAIKLLIEKYGPKSSLALNSPVAMPIKLKMADHRRISQLEQKLSSVKALMTAH